MVFQKISPEGTSTPAQFAGDVVNKISDLFSSVNIAQTDITNKPAINTETRFFPSKLRLLDTDLSHEFYFDTSSVDLNENKAIVIPLLTASSDTLLFASQAATVANKTVNIDTNLIKHSVTNAVGDILKGNGTSMQRMPRGAALQLLRTNAAGSDLEWTNPPTGAWDPAAAEAMTNKTLVASSNTITDTSAVLGDLFKHNGVRYGRFGKGAAGQYLRTNASGTDLEWASVTGAWDPNGVEAITNKTINAPSNTITNIGDTNIAAHTSTKITITAKGQLNSQTAFKDQTNTWGAFDQIFPHQRLLLGDSDATHRYIFAGSNLLADRIVTLPLLGGSDTLVCEAHAATLTGKNLNATNNTITDTSIAQGDLFVGNSASSKFLRKAKGTAMQVLRTNSGATDIEWATLDNERVGKSTAASGTATYIIAHGLGSTPTYTFVDCSSHTTARTFVVDSTNITVTFASAIASGTVTIYWRVVA